MARKALRTAALRACAATPCCVSSPSDQAVRGADVGGGAREGEPCGGRTQVGAAENRNSAGEQCDPRHSPCQVWGDRGGVGEAGRPPCPTGSGSGQVAPAAGAAELRIAQASGYAGLKGRPRFCFPSVLGLPTSETGKTARGRDCVSDVLTKDVLLLYLGRGFGVAPKGAVYEK